MKTKLVASCFVIGTLLAPAIGYTEDSGTGSSRTKTYVKHSEITTKIKAKLRNMSQIRVDTDSNGVVYLSGFARSQAEIDRAVTIARGTEGVKSVKNHIQNSMDRQSGTLR